MEAIIYFPIFLYLILYYYEIKDCSSRILLHMHLYCVYVRLIHKISCIFTSNSFKSNNKSNKKEKENHLEMDISQNPEMFCFLVWSTTQTPNQIKKGSFIQISSKCLLHHHHKAESKARASDPFMILSLLQEEENISHGTSPTNIQSPSLSSYVGTTPDPLYPSLSLYSPIVNLNMFSNSLRSSE